MAQIFRYSRSRATSVVEQDEGRLAATCRLVDTLSEISMTVVVTLPDLEIAEASAKVKRHLPDPALDPNPVISRMIGARVGSGLLKIIAGVVGEDPSMAEIAYMVEECCQAVILALTKRQLAKSPRAPEQSLPFLEKMVQKNPRLAGRCVAFTPGNSFIPLEKEAE